MVSFAFVTPEKGLFPELCVCEHALSEKYSKH